MIQSGSPTALAVSASVTATSVLFFNCNQIHASVLVTQTCISDLNTWMTRNKLKLNDENKTEVLLIKSSETIFPDALPTSLRVGTADIPFTTCTRNLGVMISDNRDT